MSADSSVASNPSHWSDKVVAHERHWLMALVITLNTFAPFCFYATTSSLQFIARSFFGEAARILWITDAYLIAVVCVTPMTGFLLRRLGHRVVLTLCIGGILTAALVASLAPTLTVLIGAALMLGMFVAPVLPATQTLVIVAYPGDHRAMGMALWGAGATVGVMVGYSAGSVLAEQFSWRVMYAPVLLLGAVSFLLVRRFAPHHKSEFDPIDWLELVAFAAGILGVGALLNLWPSLQWSKSATPYALAFAAVAGFGVFATRYRRGRGRFVDLNVLHDRNLTLAIVIAFGIAATSTGQIETAELGTLLHFDGYFIGVRGALGGVAWLIGVLGGGWVVIHMGGRRALLVALLILVWGRYGYTNYEPGLNMIGALWPNIVTSVGYGLAGTALAVVAFQNIPKRLSDAASSLYVLGWQLGPALGVAVLNGLVATREAGMIASGVNEMEARVLAALSAIWLEFAFALVLVPLVYWFRARREPVTP